MSQHLLGLVNHNKKIQSFYTGELSTHVSVVGTVQNFLSLILIPQTRRGNCLFKDT